MGYGTQKKKDLTGAIASVSSEDLGKHLHLVLTNHCKEKFQGVQVTQTTGAPERRSHMVRGISSISGSNSPLYVIDGYPIGNGGSNMSAANNSYTANGMANSDHGKNQPLSTINPSDTNQSRY